MKFNCFFCKIAFNNAFNRQGHICFPMLRYWRKHGKILMQIIVGFYRFDFRNNVQHDVTGSFQFLRLRWGKSRESLRSNAMTTHKKNEREAEEKFWFHDFFFSNKPNIQKIKSVTIMLGNK